MINGIKTITDQLEKSLALAEWGLDHLKYLKWEQRKELRKILSGYSSKISKYRPLRRIADAIRKLKKCNDLNKSFDLIEIDKNVVSEIRVYDGYNRFLEDKNISIFQKTKIPSKKNIDIRMEAGKDSRSILLEVPYPTTDAINQIQNYLNKFESIELWWIPSEIFKKEKFDKICIIVGVINIPEYGKFCFKLYSWIDSLVNISWWEK
jgi:hypothetical protein